MAAGSKASAGTVSGAAPATQPPWWLPSGAGHGADGFNVPGAAGAWHDGGTVRGRGAAARGVCSVRMGSTVKLNLV